MTQSDLEPNLFAHAKSELSQNAVWAWLLTWAEPKYASSDTTGMHQLGNAFLRLLLKERMPESIDDISVESQSNKMDLVAKINEGKIVIVIEDKINAGEHNNQLANYKQQTEEKYPAAEKIFVYLKTGNQSRANDRLIEESKGWCVIKRNDVLLLLKEHLSTVTANTIARDFFTHLEEMETNFISWCKRPIDEWKHKEEEAAWVGFYDALDKNLENNDLEWGWIQKSLFWGCWWGYKKIPKEESVQIYLQIEAHKTPRLCFKICGVSVDRKHVPEELKNRLKRAAADEENFHIEQKSLRTGKKSMTIGRYVGQFPVQNRDGFLNMEETLRIIKQAQNVVNALASEITLST